MSAKVPMTFRLPQERVEALRAHAKESGQSMTEIADTALRTALGEGSEAADVAGHRDHHEPPVQAPPRTPYNDKDEISLANWLADCTGKPRSLCAMFIEKGRVSVAGEPFKETLIARSALRDVSLDGNPVT